MMVAGIAWWTFVCSFVRLFVRLELTFPKREPAPIGVEAGWDAGRSFRRRPATPVR